MQNVSAIADDIHGSTEVEHDIILLETLDQCKRAGLSMNCEKYDINKSSVKLLGNILSNGLKPDSTKIKAIQDLQIPTSKGEVRSLIGMVTFLGKVYT